MYLAQYLVSLELAAWVKVQNFQNPELKKFKSQILLYTFKLLRISS